ncbi:hypothetical protein [Vallitalea guaymasensis]|uniref:hypothetical protein n=1 Tax=Vallitalea guaymasensis TaxID=1185412 RepID=UPI000DE4AAD7|nr:hypothetical protein [Vallitalea guaymasensis]
MRQKGKGKSAAYFIEFDKEVEEFQDLALPPLGEIVIIKEKLKYYKWKGPIKVRSGIYEVIEEYPDFYRCKKIGPSQFIASYNIFDTFQKNEFKKGLFVFEVIKREQLKDYMDSKII